MRRVLVPLTLLPAAHGVNARVESLAGQCMGTSWSVKLVPPPGLALGSAATAIQQSLDQVVSEMSQWEPNSLLSRFNAGVAGEWRDLPPGFLAVLDCALEVAAITGGAYDPTIGPLSELWGFGSSSARDSPPPEEEIAAARGHVGYSRITLDRKRRRVRQPGGCRLDLSAIAKGFAVDKVAVALKRLGVIHFLVEIGGELRGEGVKPDGSPWWVALERPPPANARPMIETLVVLHGLSVATSGDYRRFFENGGRHYSHSIDPRTGYPIDNEMVSASVLHPSCMKADVWATALTILGANDAPAIAERHEIAALLVSRHGGGLAETMTPALAAMLD